MPHPIPCSGAQLSQPFLIRRLLEYKDFDINVTLFPPPLVSGNAAITVPHPGFVTVLLGIAR